MCCYTCPTVKWAAIVPFSIAPVVDRLLPIGNSANGPIAPSASHLNPLSTILAVRQINRTQIKVEPNNKHYTRRIQINKAQTKPIGPIRAISKIKQAINPMSERRAKIPPVDLVNQARQPVAASASATSLIGVPK